MSDTSAPSRPSSAPAHKPARKRRTRDFSAGPLGWVIGWLGGFLIWVTYYTTRWERIGQDRLDALLAAPERQSGGFLVAFWHGRLFPIAMIRPKRRAVSAVISGNRDGELITRILAATGIGAIRGSSRDPRKPTKDRGGAEALSGAVEALGDGVIVAVTPDGPRGPLMRVKPGIAMMAAKAKAPVLPLAYSVSRAKAFRSWDRFLLPWPFNRGVFVYGEPMQPPDPNDPAALETFRAALEAAILAATREADQRVGRVTPEPGPPLEPEGPPSAPLADGASA